MPGGALAMDGRRLAPSFGSDRSHARAVLMSSATVERRLRCAYALLLWPAIARLLMPNLARIGFSTRR